MLQNSLVGLNQFVGEAATLRHITAETYSTVTGKPTRTFIDYPITAQIRSINKADRTKLGTELVAETSEICVIRSSQLPAGVEPLFRDMVINQAQTWEILRVRSIRFHGIVVEYQCQVQGR